MDSLSYPTVSLGSRAQPLAAKLLLHFNYYTWPPLLCRKLIYELSINSTLQRRVELMCRRNDFFSRAGIRPITPFIYPNSVTYTEIKFLLAIL